ncbi:MAG: endonuclease/exonuclease/phosphatase family protein [Candidatus Hydrogenedentota bacterium]
MAFGIPFLLGSAAVAAGPNLEILPGEIGLFFGNFGHFLMLGLLFAVAGCLVSAKNCFCLRSGFLLVLLHAMLILRWSIPSYPSPVHAATNAPEWKIVYANLGWPDMRRLPEFAAYLKAENPDMIGMVEFDPDADTMLAQVLSSYPFVLRKFREDRFGVALFSRLPFSESRIVAPDATGLPVIYARIGNPRLALWLTHPVPPSNTLQRDLRNEAIGALAASAARETGPVLIVGDLNTTERSAGYQALAKEFRDSRMGYGWSPTWIPFQKFLAPLNPFIAIPLDHAFTSGGVEIVERSVGPNFGSDHLPLKIVIRSGG